MTEKSPGDLAHGMETRKIEGFYRESFRLPRGEARRRAKQLFEQFPSSSYLTEIESWHETGGVVEFRMKRLSDPTEQDQP